MNPWEFEDVAVVHGNDCMIELRWKKRTADKSNYRAGLLIERTDNTRMIGEKFRDFGLGLIKWCEDKMPNSELDRK